MRVTPQDIIKKHLDGDQLITAQVAGITRGKCKELSDGEEYEIILKMKHVKANW